MPGPIFLSLDHVQRLDRRQIEKFGGDAGIRDVGLIDSAIAQPQQSFGGQYLHRGLAEMAASYLFHLVSNHGFVDGNKRIGAAAALVFLELNGIDTDSIDETQLEALTLAVASGALVEKEPVSSFFRLYIPNESPEKA